jgi:hypothetical protein
MYTKEEIKKDYDYLINNPEQIPEHWSTPSPLFDFVSDGREDDVLEGDTLTTSGCLTMIRKAPSRFKAIFKGKIDEHLTQKIAEDVRIPQLQCGIRQDNLDVFLEWQNRIADYRESLNIRV